MLALLSAFIYRLTDVGNTGQQQAASQRLPNTKPLNWPAPFALAIALAIVCVVIGCTAAPTSSRR
jgi:hypothetical protein